MTHKYSFILSKSQEKNTTDHDDTSIGYGCQESPLYEQQLGKQEKEEEQEDAWQ